MAITLSAGVIIQSQPRLGNTWLNTGVLNDLDWAVCDENDTLKQIRFNATPMSAGVSTIIAAGAAASNATITLPASSTTLVGTDDTATLTNKRITKRVVSGGSGTSMTPTSDTADVYSYTVTNNLTINAPTGTPTEGQTLELVITQDGTGSRTYSFNSAYAGSTDLPLPTTGSAASKVDTMLFQWSSVVSKWRLIGKVFGF